jgi:hypothetical protein
MGELTSVRPADDQHAGRIEGVFRAAWRDKSAPPPPAKFPALTRADGRGPALSRPSKIEIILISNGPG